MRIENFFSLLGNSLFLALAWYLFLLMIYGEQTGNEQANRIFYSLIMGAYIIYGSIFFEEKFGTWALFLTAFAVGVLTALYFSENGMMNGSQSVDNFLVSGFIAIFSTVTVGGVVTATVGYYFWINDIPKRRAQKEKEQQSQSNFEAEFNQFSDDGFDFDENEFSNEESSSEKTSSRSSAKSSPRGVDDRYPADAGLWAYVDDATISETERMKAFETILKRQKSRAGKTGRKVALRKKKP